MSRSTASKLQTESRHPYARMGYVVRLSLSVLLLVAPAIPAMAHAGDQSTDTTTVVCGSKPGERVSCAADTSGGVTLVAPLGTAACELGRTWGYDDKGVWVADGCGAEFSVAEPEPATFGRYTPTAGFKVADTDYGDLSIRLYGYVRYLNQQRLDPIFIDTFRRTIDIQQRQDFQVNKLQVYFFGWLMSRRFRYNTYVWTSNTALGLTSQVVVAGSLSYEFSDRLTLSGGVGGLPGVRSTEGNFPFWLMVDERQIADEYFRPSYTTGIWASGKVVDRLDYQVMWGNNLSQFGIDAGQLDNKLDTVSAALVWMPTTGEFGRNGGFGDFEDHQQPATRVGVHGTFSNETRQSQPNSTAFDNVQIRISDGSVIFFPGLFAPGLQIEEATYKMLSVDAGVKYRGFSLAAEHYWRRLDNFDTRGTGVLPFTVLRDTGFQAQASAMVRPEQVQIYAGGSKVYGEYGNPSDWRAGVTVFPWKNEVVRWNVEFIRLNRSPVGALSLPYLVGSNGPVVHSNFMVWF